MTDSSGVIEWVGWVLAYSERFDVSFSIAKTRAWGFRTFDVAKSVELGNPVIVRTRLGSDNRSPQQYNDGKPHGQIARIK